MKIRRFQRGLLALTVLLGAAPVRAQFVLFSRCQTAYPCNQPFNLQYRPDPLLAGPWSNGSPASAVSGHIELKVPPSIELDKPKTPAMEDPVNNSVRYFLRKYPPVLTKPLATTEPLPAPTPTKTKAPASPDS